MMTEPTDRDEADRLGPPREVVLLPVTIWLDPDEEEDDELYTLSRAASRAMGCGNAPARAGQSSVYLGSGSCYPRGAEASPGYSSRLRYSGACRQTTICVMPS